MTVICCMPTDSFAKKVGPVDGVETVVWGGLGPAPLSASTINFLVPPYAPGALPPQALAAMPGLQVVQLLSAGWEAWAPLVQTATVCNGRGIHGTSTAELAVVGLISAWRGLPLMHDQQRQSVWRPLRWAGAEGKRVLILGYGEIGRTVGAALALFGSEVTYVGRDARPGVRGQHELGDLLGEHDATVIAAPLTTETRGLFSKDLLARMPRGAVLVNVGRGEIVVTDDLLAELQSGRLHAVLDVTDPEPLPPEHPLWTALNTVITPHVGGGSNGWERRAAALVRLQLQRFATGDALANVVRLAQGSELAAATR